MPDAAVDHDARALINTHEKVCAERYGNLWEAVKGLRQDLQAARVSNAESQAAIHNRFNTVSNRMWAAVAGVCGVAVVMLLSGAGFLIAHLLQRGGHG